MAMQKVGLKAIFETQEFKAGQRIYEQGLNRSNAATKKTAREMERAWMSHTKGLEDLFGRMDAMHGRTEAMSKDLAAFSAEVEAGFAAAGAAVGAVATGVAAGLAIVGAGVALVYSKMDEQMREYLAGVEEVAAAQEAANEEWDRGAKLLAQAFIPLRTEMLETEAAVARLVQQTIQGFASLTAIVHTFVAGAIEALKQFNDAMIGIFRGEGLPDPAELWDRMIRTGRQKSLEVAKSYERAFAETFEKQEEQEEETGKSYERLADIVNAGLRRIADIHRNHIRKLADLERKQGQAAARAEQKFLRSLEKERQAGLEKLADITERYEDKRAETIQDAQKRIAQAEQDVYKDREKAQRDYERQRRQQEERYRLDRLQSERRYRYEWARTLAEGDALALYYMQQEHALEEQEAAENQDLQQRQTKENYEAQVKDMEESARELVAELRQSLQEQLQEQEQAYQEQIAKQKEANAERIAEMVATYEEQQALQAERDAEELRQADETYRRQLEDLGASLAEQEEIRELGEQQVKRLYDQYWSESGENELVMQGWHEREQTRITVTEDMLLGMADTAAVVAASVEDSVSAARMAQAAAYAAAIPMQYGGVLRGPAMAYVEPGMTEMFIPLSGPSTMTHRWSGGPIPVSGLERAGGAVNDQVGRAWATRLLSDISSEIRDRRRGG